MWRVDVASQRVMIAESVWKRWQDQRQERVEGRQQVQSRLRDRSCAPAYMLWSRSEQVYLDQCKKDWELMVQASCVEFVDANEQIYLDMICPSVSILYGLHPEDDERRVSDKLYHSVAIHPQADYGLTASLLVFSDFNMSQRNINAVAQEKQQIAADSFDPDRQSSAPGSHKLTMAQRAIVESHLAPMAYANKLPGCQNAKVTFINHNVKNQDDGLNLSQTSVDLGLHTIESISITTDITRPNRHYAILDLVEQIQIARSSKSHSSHKRTKKVVSSTTASAYKGLKKKNAPLIPQIGDPLSSPSLVNGMNSGSGSGSGSGSSILDIKIEGTPTGADEKSINSAGVIGAARPYRPQSKREIAADALITAAINFWDQSDVASTHLLDDEQHYVSREMYDNTGAGCLTDEEKQQACHDANINADSNLPIVGSTMGERDTVYRLVGLNPSDLTMLEKLAYMPSSTRGRKKGTVAPLDAQKATSPPGNPQQQQSDSPPTNPTSDVDMVQGSEAPMDPLLKARADDPIFQMAVAKAKVMDISEGRVPRTRHLRNYINQPQQTSVVRVMTKMNQRFELLPRISLRQTRHPVEGDKESTRAGQKGVVSYLYPRGRVPHLADGTFFDVARNPHGLSSRKTMGCLLESFYALFLMRHQNYRSVTTGMSPSRLCAFSSRFVYPSHWRKYIDSITRELLEMYNAPELGK